MNLVIITRVVALFILGFFISCSTPKEYQTIANQINSKRYTEAIFTADELIAKDSVNAEVYYYKMFALNEKVKSINSLRERYPVYKNFMSSFYKADSIYKAQKRGGSLKNVHTLREAAWAREFNLASKTALSNRTSVNRNWDLVYDAAENAIVLNKDSLQVLPYQFEAAFNSGYFIELDSLMNKYEPKIGNQDWFITFRIANLVRENNAEELKKILDSHPKLQLPNAENALVLEKVENNVEAVFMAANLVEKGEPTSEFNQLLAKLLWQSIAANSEIDTLSFVKLEKKYVDKRKRPLSDSLALDRKAILMDQVVSKIVILDADPDITQLKATLFSNLGTVYAKMSETLGASNGNQLTEKALYFYKKAIPEWNLLVYQIRSKSKEAAYQLFAIYELIGENRLALELKNEFSL